jgi:hypothetical protein
MNLGNGAFLVDLTRLFVHSCVADTDPSDIQLIMIEDTSAS